MIFLTIFIPLVTSICVAALAYMIGYFNGNRHGWDKCFRTWQESGRERHVSKMKIADERLRAAQKKMAMKMAMLGTTVQNAGEVLAAFEEELGIEPPVPKYTTKQILKKFTK